MKISTNFVLGFKRKRKGLTDYRKRLKILTSRKPRLVVRKSLKNMQAAIVEYNEKGDKVKVAAHTAQLRKLGWQFSAGNIPASYLVGYLLAKKSLKQNVQEAVLDIGMHKAIHGGRIFAVLAGAVDGGLQVAHGSDALPSKERLNGKHIQSYATQLKKEDALYKKQFGVYLLQKHDPEMITKNFDDVKKAIEKM